MKFGESGILEDLSQLVGKTIIEAKWTCRYEDAVMQFSDGTEIGIYGDRDGTIAYHGESE